MENSEKLFYKDLLIKERNNLLETLKKMDEHDIGEAGNLSSTELSSYDNHPADLGTEVFNFGMNLNLKMNERSQISEIERSLKKLENNTYGSCERCGNGISKTRLEVRPSARLCINCENEKNDEMKNIKKARPIEEEVIGSPFERKYLNKREDDEYEGLDYLNDLMKYGSASTPQDMGGYEEYEEFYTNKVDKQGLVEEVDNISNQQYKNQLPD